jgi:hypothetical protein
MTHLRPLSDISSGDLVYILCVQTHLRRLVFSSSMLSICSDAPYLYLASHI